MYVFTGEGAIRDFIYYYVPLFVNDLRCVLVPPWFLLWASAEMRKRVRQKLARKQKQQLGGGGGGAIQVKAPTNVVVANGKQR
jgi:hypothetical protein